ncbi:hypothetical protein DPMN_147611 [Dreissena polymorpha]|uniref:Uncharacterized protein n=1 Tax=Dreissena polymorpha TaxID=45954 RepID=A0A9D4F869_DREPO|nr:hypothetical protein DPMN_147611 [Dreissena polymorpha]
MIKFLLDQSGYLLGKGADINLVEHVSDQNGGSEKREEQTALMWAYEEVTLSAHGGYSQPGGEGPYCWTTTYTIAGPGLVGIGREILSTDILSLPLNQCAPFKPANPGKIDVLQLRADLPHQFHILISDIDFQDVIGSGSFGKQNGRSQKVGIRDASRGARRSQSSDEAVVMTSIM